MSERITNPSCQCPCCTNSRQIGALIVNTYFQGMPLILGLDIIAYIYADFYRTALLGGGIETGNDFKHAFEDLVTAQLQFIESVDKTDPAIIPTTETFDFRNLFGVTMSREMNPDEIRDAETRGIPLKFYKPEGKQDDSGNSAPTENHDAFSRRRGTGGKSGTHIRPKSKGPSNVVRANVSIDDGIRRNKSR